MANFRQVVVDHTPQSRARRVTLTPGSRVQAIFVDGAEKTLLPGKEPRRVTTPPDGVFVESQTPSAAEESDDLTPVCYLINGELLCW